MSGRGREIDLSLYNAANEHSSSVDNRKKQSSSHDNRHGNDKKKRKRKKKKHIGFKLIVVIISILVIIGGFMYITAKYIPGGKEFLITKFGAPVAKLFLSEDEYNKIYDSTFGDGSIVVNEGIDRSKYTGYYTLAIFGIDSRDNRMDAGVNSDSIMLVSINQDTGHVVISSVYRDTWLNIPTEGQDNVYRKINSAYCVGGVKSAVSALNKNFDLAIDDYVTINFEGLTNIIDKLGGLDLNINEEEVKYINSYLVENRKITGIDAPNVEQAGNVHLSGLQVTAYCRIRYCAFYDSYGNKYVDDMGRTARQRYVMTLMVKKAKSVGVKKLLEIANEIFNGKKQVIMTSIAYDKMLEMIPVFIDFELGETKGFPFTYGYPNANLTRGESAVGIGGLSYNVKKLHSFLYGNNNYTPSAAVSEINDKLYDLTGINDILLPEDKE